jgi:hypothetical protein
MDISTPVLVTILGGLGSIVGYFVSSYLERGRAARLREMEFRLDRYKEFLLAFGQLSGKATPETQSRFVDSVNVILLIGGSDLLYAIKALVDDYNDPLRTGEEYRPILDSIMYAMRRDLNAPDAKKLATFSFPVIVPDIE